MRYFTRFLCWFGFHNYYEVRRLNTWTHLMGCYDCPKLWGMNTDAQVLIPWTYELYDHHRERGDIE